MTQEVWILWNNIESSIYGVFSSREKAVAAAIEVSTGDYDHRDWSFLNVPLDELKVV